MTGKFKVDGDNVTVTFSYTALTAKVQDVIDNCAEHLWVEELDEEGEIINPFESASNQDKLNIVDVHFLSVLLNMAKSHYVNKKQIAERQVATLHADDNLSIG